MTRNERPAYDRRPKMKFFVKQDFEDGEHTIYNEKMERVGGSMTMDPDQIRPSIAYSVHIPESKLNYVCDQLCYEVWEADCLIGALCPQCDTRVDQARAGHARPGVDEIVGELMAVDPKTGYPVNWCHVCDTNLIWDKNGWSRRDAD